MRPIWKQVSSAILAALTTSLAHAARADEAAVSAPNAHAAEAPTKRCQELRRALGGGPEPKLHLDIGAQCMRIELPLFATVRGEGVSSFPVDRFGSRFGPTPSVSPMLRLGARFSTGLVFEPVLLLAEAELDVPTGVVAPSPDLGGQGFPGSEGLDVELRKLHLRASVGSALHLDLGVQTSHFGMGLVANDGAHGWEPGSAAFLDPRSGDRVLRAELSTGPHTPAHVALAVGADKVLRDDALLEGDSARQFFGAVLFGVGTRTSGGAYLVRRHQESAGGRETDVTIMDATGKASFDIPGARLELATEWALITGRTGLGATVENPTHRVLEIGGAAHAALDAGAFGTVIDFLYASGDPSPSDTSEHGFHVDPNYAFGLLLFRHVTAAVSARTAGLAGDPTLVGVPQDAERVAARGGASNTVAFFPKLRYRPVPKLELYGGPLFAFANAPNIDVFNTKIAGGTPRSPLGGDAGRYLGTELDLGARYRTPLAGGDLVLGAEIGAVSPGNAFLDASGAKMGAIYGGRAIARYRF